MHAVKLIIFQNSSAENIYDFTLLFCYEKKTIYYLLQNMHVTFDLKDTISDTMIIIKKKIVIIPAFWTLY